MNQRPIGKTVIWVIAFLILLMLMNRSQTQKPPPDISFGDFMSHVEKGGVKEVVIENKNIRGVLTDGKPFKTYAPEYPNLVQILRDHNVQISAKPPDELPWYLALLSSWGPTLIFIGLFLYLMRGMAGAAGGAISKLTQNKAKLFEENDIKITFKDVAGVDEAKEELSEIIEFLRDPKKFSKLGGRIPKGVLLVGAPGTGKTLMARAVAGEAGVPFFSISGSAFVEMFVGVGAARVRELFAQAKQRAPCIIFIDELDAIGRQRGAGLGGGHDEREQTLNQILVEMDGFDTSAGVIMISATNRPDVLDPALTRSGRFDRRVVVQRPDIKGREEILKVHARKIILAEDVNLGIVARGTPGFVGADLEELLNEAALAAARKNKEKVDMADVEEAKDKVLMGAERKSMVISDREKKITAYHEAGHTLVSKSIPGTDPIHKVTIIPRGMALGSTNPLPQEELHNYTKSSLEAELAILMGGRAAEELVFGDYTTGAANDIARATEFARKMVCEWGMSEKLGPLKYGNAYENPFLGRELTELSKNYSEYTARAIDQEIQKFVNKGYERAGKILTEKKAALYRLADELLLKEALDSAQIDAVINNENQTSPKF